MTSPLCPACGANSQLRFQSRIDVGKFSPTTYSSRKTPELMHHDYFECGSCRYLFTENVEISNLSDQYRESIHESSNESEFAANTYVRLFRKFGQGVPKSALDVGCSDGRFLSKLIDIGTEFVIGIEPSIDAVRYIKNPDINVFQGTLEEFTTASKFDAVFLLQTIEHIPSPEIVLHRLMNLVAPKGLLMIVCHDRHSLVNRLLGQRSPVFDIEHLQIFNKKAIGRMIEREGYRVAISKRFTNRYPLSYALRLGIPRFLSSKFVSGVLRLWDPSIPFPAGNLVVMVRHNTSAN